jgi:hypothetical protein
MFVMLLTSFLKKTLTGRFLSRPLGETGSTVHDFSARLRFSKFQHFSMPLGSRHFGWRWQNVVDPGTVCHTCTYGRHRGIPLSSIISRTDFTWWMRGRKGRRVFSACRLDAIVVGSRHFSLSILKYAVIGSTHTTDTTTATAATHGIGNVKGCFGWNDGHRRRS